MTTAPDHAAIERSDSFYADVRRGVKYAIARRAKLVAYIVTVAGLLLSRGLVSGAAANVCGLVILLAGGGAVYQARNAEPVASGPKPHERATQRGLADHAATEEA